MIPIDERSGELPVESLRRLARGLVLDRGSAEDVVQEAWLAALRTRGEIGGLGAWLAGAVRRLARNRARASERRDRRERLAARAEAQPSAIEASARIEILQRVLAAVERLPSPYRESIVLRYFDDLPPREIARRLDVPVNTVRTHVRRGLARLRAELDPGPGREREALLAALVPLLGPGLRLPGGDRQARTPPGTRTLIMTKPLVLATSVLVLGTLSWLTLRAGEPSGAGATLGLVPTPRPPGASPPQAAASVVAATPAPQGTTSTSPQGRSERASAWTVRGHVTRGPWESYAGAHLVGRIYAGPRAEGAPLSEERFRASEQGTFAWAPVTPEELFTLEVAGDSPNDSGRPARRWLLPGDPAPEDVLLGLYPRDMTVQGTLRDANGAGIPDAWVGTALGDEAHAVRSGADGSYALPCSSLRLPRFVCAWKPGLAPGYTPFAGPALDVEHPIDIALPPELRLHGTVRDVAGMPVAGAVVSVEEQNVPYGPSIPSQGAVTIATSVAPLIGGAWPHVLTDASGSYDIGGIHPQGAMVLLRATVKGRGSGEVACPQLAKAGDRTWDISLAEDVILTGRVRAGGAPVAGAWISVGDWIGQAEGVETWSDSEGRFTLTGVAPGPQHLWFWRRGFSSLRRDVQARGGEAALELELPPAHFVAGVVLGPDGAPAPWATISAEDASGSEPPAIVGFLTCTGPDGRFRIPDLPAGIVSVVVNAQGCRTLAQETAVDRDDLVLKLEPRASIAASPRTAGTVRSSPAPASNPVVAVTSARGHGALYGRLLDLAGHGRAGEVVELAAAETALILEPWRTTTDVRGGFELTALPAGTFDLRWVRREAGLEVVDLEQRTNLADGEQRELELRPEGQAAVRGTIVFLTEPPKGSVTAGYGKPPVFGAPPGGMPAVVQVRLQRLVDDKPSPTWRRGGFAYDGVFTIEGLPPGEWRVEAELVLPDRGPVALTTEGSKGRYSSGTWIKVPPSGEVVVRIDVLYVQ